MLQFLQRAEKVGPAASQLIYAAGYTTTEKLRDATVDDLITIRGVTLDQAIDLIEVTKHIGGVLELGSEAMASAQEQIEAPPAPAPEPEPEPDEPEMVIERVKAIPGIGLSTAEAVYDGGVINLEQLADATEEDLAAMNGITRGVARKIARGVESGPTAAPEAPAEAPAAEGEEDGEEGFFTRLVDRFRGMFRRKKKEPEEPADATPAEPTAEAPGLPESELPAPKPEAVEQKTEETQKEPAPHGEKEREAPPPPPEPEGEPEPPSEPRPKAAPPVEAKGEGESAVVEKGGAEGEDELFPTTEAPAKERKMAEPTTKTTVEDTAISLEIDEKGVSGTAEASVETEPVTTAETATDKLVKAGKETPESLPAPEPEMETEKAEEPPKKKADREEPTPPEPPRAEVVEAFKSIKGVGNKIAHELYLAGYRSWEDFQGVTVQDLTPIPGMTTVRARRIISTVRQKTK